MITLYIFSYLFEYCTFNKIKIVTESSGSEYKFICIGCFEKMCNRTPTIITNRELFEIIKIDYIKNFQRHDELQYPLTPEKIRSSIEYYLNVMPNICVNFWCISCEDAISQKLNVIFPTSLAHSTWMFITGTPLPFSKGGLIDYLSMHNC